MSARIPAPARRMLERLARELAAADYYYHSEFEGDDDARRAYAHPEWARTVKAARKLLAREEGAR